MEALKKGNHSGLVKKLVAEVESLMHQAGDLRAELAAERAKGEERDLARPDVEHVLVLVEGDGSIEVWAEPYVRVRVVHLPDMRSKTAAQLADELLLAKIPLPYAELRDKYPATAHGHVRCCPHRDTLHRLKETLGALEYAKRLEEACQAAAANQPGAA